MRVSSKWYQEPSREDDDHHIHFIFKPRKQCFYLEQTGRHTRNASLFKMRKKKPEMKRGDMLPPVPKQAFSARIRDDQVLHEFVANSDGTHRVTHGLIIAEPSSRNV